MASITRRPTECLVLFLAALILAALTFQGQSNGARDLWVSGEHPKEIRHVPGRLLVER